MSSLKLLFLGLVLLIVLISCYLSSQLPDVTDITVSSRHSESKKPTAHVQESAAKSVLGRLLPTHVSSFEFKIRSKDVCDGCFSISNYKSYSRNEQEIMIEGTTAVDITAGLYWYLKYWCGAHVSWDKTGGVQIASVPNQGSLPLVADQGVEIQLPVPWIYTSTTMTEETEQQSLRHNSPPISSLLLNTEDKNSSLKWINTSLSYPTKIKQYLNETPKEKTVFSHLNAT